MKQCNSTIFCHLCGEPLCKDIECEEHLTEDWDYIIHMQKNHRIKEGEEKMINSTEDAQKYLDEVHQHLQALTVLAMGAGMNTHAGMWCAIEAAFCESMDEVKTVTDMLYMYINAKRGMPIPKLNS